ncbi:hypothetical protein EV44_g6019 [Erysiphe necator]|uniref:Uncharacterized protein n=1 Tax=Uncinula necator TaxID=52586 RepID=A0A0B1NZG8_UNCNE|nr:hypothetical protein EV44_g6019 [Erysiphe necator]
MAQTDIAASIQTLQDMVNLVLVKTGNSLRHRKYSPKSQVSSCTGQSFNLPYAVENFHMALDDLETEILLSKAALSRDLESLKSNHKEPEKSSSLIIEQEMNEKKVAEDWKTDCSGSVNVNVGVETGAIKESPDNSGNNNFTLPTNLGTPNLGLEVSENLSTQISDSNLKSSNLDIDFLENTKIHDQKKVQNKVLDSSAIVTTNSDTSRKSSLDSLFEGQIIGHSITISNGDLNDMNSNFQINPEQISKYSQVQKTNLEIFGPEQGSQLYNMNSFQNLGNSNTTLTGSFDDSNFSMDQIMGNGNSLAQYNSTNTHDGVLSHTFFG